MTDLSPKMIVRVLDRAAARSSYPATPKQTWFLATLWAKQNNEVDYNDFLLDDSAALSKDMASGLIDLSLKSAQ